MSKLILVLMFFSFGFNWHECREYRKKHLNFAAPVASFLSTSGFTSSLGPCSMLGKLENDSKVYVLHNIEQMKGDFARGQGEYAMAFASMYGCDHEAQKTFPRIIKDRFDEMLRSETDEDLERVHALLNREIRMNQALAPKCLIPNG